MSLAEVHNHIKAFNDDHQTVCLVGHADDMPKIISIFDIGNSSYGSENALPVVLEFNADSWKHVTRSRLSGYEVFLNSRDYDPTIAQIQKAQKVLGLG